MSLRERLQASMRRCTDTHPKWFPYAVLLGASIFFALMCWTVTWPRVAETVDPDDYPNEGIQLSFTGDTVMARYIAQRAEVEGYDKVLEGVEEVWANSDFTFTNLEYTVLTEATKDAKATKNKKVVLDGTTESVQALKDAGINVFGIANNHSTDYGTEALDGEIEYLASTGTNFAGYYLSEDALPEYDGLLTMLYERFQEQPYARLTCGNGTTIGFLAVVDPSTSETALSRRILKTSTGDMYNFVNMSSSDNDLTIVYLHCGTENTLGVENGQKEYAHALIDAGADIVIEAHAHAILPVEEYEGGIIFYGMGNFIMDQEQLQERDSMIVQYNANGEGRGYFEIIPCHINNGYTQVTTNPLFINRINSIITRYLDKTEYEVNDRGHIVIPWSKEDV